MTEVVLVGAPGTRHEARRDTLHALAVLAGYTLELPAGFPDGRRPDVARLHAHRRSVFIGDAKDSEGPLGMWTRVRLLAYLRWFAAEVRRQGSDGVFVVCFGVRTDAQRWCDTLRLLAREVGLTAAGLGEEEFGEGFSCAWIRTGGNGNDRVR